ncbi:uncharacterized protein O3Q21_016370 [Podargus strigoides]
MAAWAVLLLGVLLLTHRPGDAGLLEANGNLSCRCAKTTRVFISPRKYSSIEVRPVGSSCRRLEVVITLKSLEKVCVHPDTPWVKKLLQDLPNLSNKSGGPRSPSLASLLVACQGPGGAQGSGAGVTEKHGASRRLSEVATVVSAFFFFGWEYGTGHVQWGEARVGKLKCLVFLPSLAFLSP